MRPPSLSPLPQADRVEFLLRAERDAENRVTEAERTAQRTVEAAREQARHIAARTDARMAGLALRAANSVQRRIDALRRESEARGAARRRPIAEASHIETAVQRVVDWLLGEDTGTNRGAGR